MIDVQQGRVCGKGIRSVVYFTLAGRRETGAGEGVVQGGPHGVNVSPWAHISVWGTLFRRAEAGGFDNVFSKIAIGFSCGTEIDDNRQSGAGNENVVRFDVSMKEFEAVKIVEGIEQAYHESEQCGLRYGGAGCSMLGSEFIQRDAVDVFYNIIGGLVFFEIRVYFGNTGVIQCAQQAYLAQEIVSSPVIAFLTFFRMVHADVQCAFLAVAERIREAFFDDDIAVEQGFLSQIGYAEASASNAALHSVSMQKGADGEFLGCNEAR